MKLCLNMIVKNEAARIERCLASVAPYISSWCIVDTGSTDNTKDIVKRFFTKQKIGGYLFDELFIDFSASRNFALLKANAVASHHDDYLLLVDADMELVVDDPAWHLTNFTAPSYKILQKNGGLSYWNTRLLKRDAKARYIGATHEYLSINGGGEAPNLAGAWFLDHADGANREGKFQRDAALLKAEITPQARSWYYLAQSLRDMGDKRAAAEAYGVRTNLGGWDEEAWHAELSRARCLHDYGASEWVDVALSAYGHRPHRAEPLYDLAKYYREKGLNEVSLLFSARGLGTRRPQDDLLFVEDAVYNYGLLEEFAICAFYSDKHRDHGRYVCNNLALDRGVPVQVRDSARRNLFWYAQPLSELCPSFKPTSQIRLPGEEWVAMNPSIARLGDEIKYILRTVNYHIDDAGRYVMPEGETAISTRNYLGSLDSDLKHGSMRELTLEIDIGDPLYDQVLGLEDMRLFEWRGHLWYSATTRQTNAEGMAEQGCGQIGGSYVLMHPDGERLHEKNWMPIVGKEHKEIQFIYRCDPTRIVTCAGETMRETMPPFACENFSGGSQAIPFDDGFITLIHEAIQSPIDGKRCYQHRFVWFDGEINLKHVSPRFWFYANNQIEFAAGLCWHPNESQLIISYGIRDAEAWLATVDADDVRGLLGLPMPSAFFGESELLPLARIQDGVVTVVTLPDLPAQCDPLSYSWALGNTNRPLRTHAEIDVARAHLNNLRLPLHPDHPKNWDNLVAIAHATATTAKDGWVMDAGGTSESVFLPGLKSQGYKNLSCVNTDWNAITRLDRGIVAFGGDITNLQMVQAFDFIACLSVIEHGVDVRAFLREMARVIKPGGHLFLSFDYWQDPIDCGDRVAFGAPVRVFARDDVWKMIYYAGDHGLTPVGEVDYKCGEHVVSWLGLDFTFMNLLFRRG